MYAQHAVGASDAYLYAPVFAQFLAPLAHLGWLIFSALWFRPSRPQACGGSPANGASWPCSCPSYTPGPRRFSICPSRNQREPATFSFSSPSRSRLWFRRPAAWALPLLTKPTLGVGLLWYAVRREWRNVGIAIGTTALIGLCSVILAPSLWLDWLRVLADNAASAAPSPYDAPFQFFPLGPRLAFAAIPVVWGAWNDRRWTLVVATSSPCRSCGVRHP